MWYAQYIYIHNVLPSPTWLLPFFGFLVILAITAAKTNQKVYSDTCQKIIKR